MDSQTREVGLLVERYDVFQGYFHNESEEIRSVWAWEILWVGSQSKKENRYQSYTELGLVSLLRDKTLKLITLNSNGIKDKNG